MHYAIALLLGLAVSLTWAQERTGALPAGASQLLVRGETYYYSGGTFYRPDGRGYLRVDPPLGARVPDVPGDAGSFTIGGDRYVVTGSGSFFLYDPRGGDYSVVSPPPGWRDYYRGSPELQSLAAPEQPRAIPRAYPRAEPGYRAEPGGGAYRSDYYGSYPGGGYYGRYGFRDNIRDESYEERRSTCRRIADDQSRRARVGPYRRQPGSYSDEYERCMR